MQEIFIEESAALRDDKKAKRWYTVFSVISIVGFVLAVLVLLFLFMLLFMPVDSETAESVDTSDVWVQLLILAVIIVLLFLTGVLFRIKRHNFYISYDYTYVSGELRIAKVIHDRKRKVLYRLTDEQLILIGRVGGDSYDKLKRSPDCKEDILTPNEETDDEKEFFYIQAATKVGKRLLVLECRPQFIATVYRNNQNRRILASDFMKK